MISNRKQLEQSKNTLRMVFKNIKHHRHEPCYYIMISTNNMCFWYRCLKGIRTPARNLLSVREMNH